MVVADSKLSRIRWAYAIQQLTLYPFIPPVPFIVFLQGSRDWVRLLPSIGINLFVLLGVVRDVSTFVLYIAMLIETGLMKKVRLKRVQSSKFEVLSLANESSDLSVGKKLSFVWSTRGDCLYSSFNFLAHYREVYYLGMDLALHQLSIADP